MTMFRRALLGGATAALLASAGARSANGREAAVRRHARDRHDVRDPVGAVVGSARLELEAQPRHRPVLRAAVAGDLDKSKRKGGKHPFVADAYLATEAIRGELAEKWELVENPLRVVFNLRKGVMFPEKPGVMKKPRAHRRGRRLQLQPAEHEPQEACRPTSTTSSDVEATDSHTVVFYFKEYNAEWDYRFGWGYYSAIMPKEVADAGANNWKNVNGTGPFMLTDFVAGNSNTYIKNPDYWDKEKIGGSRVQAAVRRQDDLPHHQGRGDAACTALRTGKLDMLETIRWQHVDDLKKSAPAAAVEPLAEPIRAPSWRCASTRSRSTTSACAARSTWRSTRRRSSRRYYSGNAELFAYPHASRLRRLLRAARKRCRPR